MDKKRSSNVSPHPPSIIIPVQSPDAPFSDDDMNKTTSSFSSYRWSWTLTLIVWPFTLWGCPFYLLVLDQFPRYGIIRTTRSWLKRIFDCSSSFGILAIPTFLLFCYTVLLDAYVIYLFSILAKSLFIDGIYASSMYADVLDFLRDIPVVIPLNYVWIRGFTVNNFLCLLNRKYRKYGCVSCTGFLVKLILLFAIIGCIHIIRYFSYNKYQYDPSLNATDNILGRVKHVWDLSLDVFVTLILPIYCFFCFALRYEFRIIKAVVYDMISNRVTPTLETLDLYKLLYTHVADHIDLVNHLFSIYLALAIVVMIIGTIMDAEHLLVAFSGLTGNIFESLFGADGPLKDLDPSILMTPSMASSTETVSSTDSELEEASTFLSSTLQPMPSPTSLIPLIHTIFKKNPKKTDIEPLKLDPSKVRQINADLLCIILIYAAIFYTLWQAVITNDAARELNVWLNDFVVGGTGTDVDTILLDLGVASEEDIENNEVTRRKQSTSTDSHEWFHLTQPPPIWAHNKTLENGESDQFMEKFERLKCYIHVRMQLEKPALLSIALIGFIVPSLSGRLKRYSVIY